MQKMHVVFMFDNFLVLMSKELSRSKVDFLYFLFHFFKKTKNFHNGLFFNQDLMCETEVGTKR